VRPTRWGSTWWRCCCLSSPPEVGLSGCLGPNCTERGLIPWTWGQWWAWRVLWNWRLRCSRWTAFLLWYSSFPGGIWHCAL
jgi:hypothetical protein